MLNRRVLKKVINSTMAFPANRFCLGSLILVGVKVFYRFGWVVISFFLLRGRICPSGFRVRIGGGSVYYRHLVPSAAYHGSLILAHYHAAQGSRFIHVEDTNWEPIVARQGECREIHHI